MYRRCRAGNLRQFSVERLLRFLVALDQDVQIVVKPHRDTRVAPAWLAFCNAKDGAFGLVFLPRLAYKSGTRTWAPRKGEPGYWHTTFSAIAAALLKTVLL